MSLLAIASVPALLAEAEATALDIQNWQPFTISGLLQTEGYMRAVAAALQLEPNEIDNFVQARTQRQSVLEGRLTVTPTFFISEAALAHLAAHTNRDVVRGQFQRLVTVIEQGQAEIRVVPFGLGITVVETNPFHLIQCENHSILVIVEHLHYPDIVTASRDDPVVKACWLTSRHLSGIALSQPLSLALIQGYTKRSLFT